MFFNSLIKKLHFSMQKYLVIIYENLYYTYIIICNVLNLCTLTIYCILAFLTTLVIKTSFKWYTGRGGSIKNLVSIRENFKFHKV